MKQQIRLRQQPVTREVGFWSTPSTTGELAFMNGMITVFEVQIDREGNLLAREWRWGWKEILY
jgi:hypothetical protein